MSFYNVVSGALSTCANAGLSLAKGAYTLGANIVTGTATGIYHAGAWSFNTAANVTYNIVAPIGSGAYNLLFNRIMPDMYNIVYNAAAYSGKQYRAITHAQKLLYGTFGAFNVLRQSMTLLLAYQLSELYPLNPQDNIIKSLAKRGLNLVIGLANLPRQIMGILTLSGKDLNLNWITGHNGTPTTTHGSTSSLKYLRDKVLLPLTGMIGRFAFFRWALNNLLQTNKIKNVLPVLEKWSFYATLPLSEKLTQAQEAQQYNDWASWISDTTLRDVFIANDYHDANGFFSSTYALLGSVCRIPNDIIHYTIGSIYHMWNYLALTQPGDQTSAIVYGWFKDAYNYPEYLWNSASDTIDYLETTPGGTIISDFAHNYAYPTMKFSKDLAINSLSWAANQEITEPALYALAGSAATIYLCYHIAQQYGLRLNISFGSRSGATLTQSQHGGTQSVNLNFRTPARNGQDQGRNILNQRNLATQRASRRIPSANQRTSTSSRGVQIEEVVESAASNSNRANNRSPRLLTAPQSS